MKELFKDVLGIEGVHGVLCLTTEGAVAFSQFSKSYGTESHRIEAVRWPNLIKELAEIAEAEIMFDAGRLYIRRSSHGYLLVVLEDHAPVSMVRLNCDVLMPSLDKQKFSKGLGQLLRKRRF
jgi:hypothetical protein